MTIEQVKERVKHIESISNDDEAAHSNEDALWRDVLSAVAKGHPDSVKLAKEALKTEKISYARWCA